MPDYEFPQLDADQERVVRLLNDTWQSRHMWPSFDFVASRLGRDSEQTTRLLHSFPTVGGGQPLALSYSDVIFERLFPAPPDDSKVRLTVRGLARDRRGADIAVAFVVVLSQAAQKWLDAPDDPGSVKQIKLTFEDVHAVSPAIAHDDLLGVGALLETEPFQGRASVGSVPTRQWTLHAGRGVTRYLGMQVEDYLASIEADVTVRTAANPVDDVGLSAPTTSLEIVPEPLADKVFISHAGADRELGKLFKQTLQLAGVPSTRIFYSSSRDTGIPTGSDLRSRLQQELADAALVIELLTPTFFQRPMCLMEVGGAWALRKPTFPIVVPPTSLADAQALLGEVIMGQLTSNSLIDDTFSDLYDQIVASLGIPLAMSAWTESLRSLRSGLPGVLAQLRRERQQPTPGSAPVGGRSANDPVLLSDIRWVDAPGGGGKVFGRIENNSGRALDMISVRAVFLHGAEAVDTADGFVSQLSTRSPKTFTIDCYNTPADFDDVKVEIVQYL